MRERQRQHHDRIERAPRGRCGRTISTMTIAADHADDPPTPTWRTERATMSRSSPPPAKSGATMQLDQRMVRKIATGSLVPDSTSSVERTRSRSVMPPTRSRKNTAAASVGATIAPRRKPVRSSDSPKISCAASRPERPSEHARPSPGPSPASAATRSVATRVAKPKSNRMIASAMRADEKGGPAVVELDADQGRPRRRAGRQQEDEEQRGAEAKADEAGEHRRDDERRTDEDRQNHRFEHRQISPEARNQRMPRKRGRSMIYRPKPRKRFRDFR